MLLLELDGRGSLQRQTYRALRAAILGGRLQPGERLASTRELARELGIARNTILQAYDRLIAEGYATTRAAPHARAARRRRMASRAYPPMGSVPSIRCRHAT